MDKKIKILVIIAILVFGVILPFFYFVGFLEGKHLGYIYGMLFVVGLITWAVYLKKHKVQEPEEEKAEKIPDSISFLEEKTKKILLKDEYADSPREVRTNSIIHVGWPATPIGIFGCNGYYRSDINYFYAYNFITKKESIELNPDDERKKEIKEKLAEKPIERIERKESILGPTGLWAEKEESIPPSEKKEKEKEGEM